MQQNLIVNIGSKEERSFEEYVHIKNRLRDFLTLAMSESVQTLTFEGQVRTQENQKDRRVPIDTTVKIFYRTTNFVYPQKKISPRHILFRYHDISDEFANFITYSFSKEEILAPVYDLYFGTLHDPDMYLSYQFLGVIQAIETYHRRRRHDNKEPPATYKKRYDEIIEAIPDKHRKWLKSALAFSNQRILRYRLEDLVNEDFEKITELFVENRPEFIQNLLDTRNYLTHYIPKLREKAAKDDALAKLTGRAVFLLQTILLCELGFDIDRIEKIIPKNKHFDYLKSQQQKSEED